MKIQVLPTTASKFKRYWPAFEAWLIERGSSIIGATNPYEITRFLTDEGVGIVYINSAGTITSWLNGADRAFVAFRTGTSWRAVEKVKRGTSKARKTFKTLADRDGPNCIYCGAGLAVDTATIEHIVPLSAGGPDHLSNKALACRCCNQAVGSLPAAQKVMLAVRRLAGGANA